jgi:hypothetical protein
MPLLWLVIGAGACVRAGFDGPGPDGAPDRGDVVVGDLLRVGDGPEGDVDGARPDATVGPLGKLTCEAPQEVGTSAPVHISEAALTPDGLELVSRDYPAGVAYSTKRPSLSQPFGAWGQSSLLSGWADPTFFVFGNTEYAVVASTVNPRHLALCKLGAPSDCAALSIRHEAGQPATEDMDGPSVAALPDGSLLMAHNMEQGGETDIYLARTSDANPALGWVTAPVAAVNQAGVKEDDPALSPDGLTLVFNKPDSGNIGQLWVSERSSTTAPFPAPRLLADVNSTSVDGSAHLAPWQAAGAGKIAYELFFSSERKTGDYLVFRSVCTR